MYPSLKHFRKAASSRSTFHDMLLQIVQALKWKNMPNALSPMITSSITTGALTRKNDTRVIEVAWGNISTGTTPLHSIKNGTQQLIL